MSTQQMTEKRASNSKKKHVNSFENSGSSKKEIESFKTPNNESIKTPVANMLEKWELNAPYYIFFNTIPEIPDTLNEKNSITFSDLLCPSLGKLKRTMQISFAINFEWLMEQYETKHVESLPLTILGSSQSAFQRYMEENFSPQITHHSPEMPYEYGLHHSKIGIYAYDDDSLRVVVSTANLYEEDWEIRNQALWLSPRCPLMTDETINNGDSPTGFKYDLLNYLKSYEAPCLRSWIEQIEKVDFSQIRVFLVTSIPGKQYPEEKNTHIYTVSKILRRHCTLPEETISQNKVSAEWPVIGQVSAIGSVGIHQTTWFLPILKALSAHTGISPGIYPYAVFKCIFPSVDNVENGITDRVTLQYEDEIYQREKWFHGYIHQWKADRLNRSKVMPHIKTYTRVSPCSTKLAYFLLTSANFSRGGWGDRIQPDGSVNIRSYEAGVLFLPKFFDEDYFEITETVNNKNDHLFPVMYDIPLTPYSYGDSPYTRENQDD